MVGRGIGRHWCICYWKNKWKWRDSALDELLSKISSNKTITLQRTWEENNFEFSTFCLLLKVRGIFFGPGLGLYVLSEGVVIETFDTKLEASILCIKLDSVRKGFILVKSHLLLSFVRMYLFHKPDGLRPCIWPLTLWKRKPKQNQGKGTSSDEHATDFLAIKGMELIRTRYAWGLNSI